MASRTNPVRMTSNYLDHTFEVPHWIKRMGPSARVNYITQVYSELCADNWYLYISTAVETLPTLIYQLKAISKVDVIKELLEHKYKCGLRQAIGSGKKVPKTGFQKAATWFWKIEGVRGQLVWYWIVFEAVTAYIINWQSIVIEQQTCHDKPHAGPCILDTPGSTLEAGTGIETLFWNTREFDPSGWSGVGADPTAINPAALGTFNVGASVSAIWPAGGNISWSLQVRDAAGRVVASSGTITGDAGQPQTATCFGRTTALTLAEANFIVTIDVTARDRLGFGSCPTGTFSVGLSN